MACIGQVSLTLKPAALTPAWCSGAPTSASTSPPTSTTSPPSTTRRCWQDGATVETVEHLLAALISAGVDNVIIELTQREVPIMDGSSAPFLFLIQEAGLKKQSAARGYLKVLRPISVASGDKHIAIYPSDHFKVSYTISFDHPMLRHQSRTMRITEQTFNDEIASARTFGFLKEVEWMRQQGLALGGSLDNAIVIGDTGPLNALRFDDEFVRHKILDAVGDLALLGRPVLGHVVAHRAGHALHTQLAKQLLSEADACTVVDSVAVAAAGSDAVPVAARAR
jgi:UDP-3-O-[3-hydroxymyristoyl] N-acetylglucosamine deacetylase